MWFYLGLAGNLVQTMGAIVSILMEFVLIERSKRETLVGFGTMLAWVTIMKYLKYADNVDLLTSTLYHSWRNIFMFLVGVLPFFMGFVFLGQCIFWKYDKFEDMSATVVTLFALSNGDIVNDTFLETWSEGFIGQVYLIVFMILFYTAVQNVFITIIMEGYENSIKQKEYRLALEDREEVERSKIEEEFLSVVEGEGEGEGETHPLRLNAWRVEQIIREIRQILKEQQEAALPSDKERVLLMEYKQMLLNLSQNLRYQLKSL